jgi:hypothetical protein
MSTMVLEGAERQLVEACQRDAFCTLFENCKNKVYSVALRLLSAGTVWLSARQPARVAPSVFVVTLIPALPDRGSPE